MHSILNQQLSAFKDAFHSLVCFKLKTYFFIFQLMLLAITKGVSHYSGVAISCYRMDYNKRFVMKRSTNDYIRHDIGRHVAYINMGGEKWRHLEVVGERGVTSRTVVEIPSFEGNFSFRGM